MAAAPPVLAVHAIKGDTHTPFTIRTRATIVYVPDEDGPFFLQLRDITSTDAPSKARARFSGKWGRVLYDLGLSANKVALTITGCRVHELPKVARGDHPCEFVVEDGQGVRIEIIKDNDPVPMVLDDAEVERRIAEPAAAVPAVNAPAKKKKATAEYTYTPIGQLEVGKALVNFFGIVLSFNGPKSTKGSDMVMNFVLVDESTPTDGIPLNIFYPEKRNFPEVQRGDVMRVHRMRLQLYEGKIQGVKAGTATALYAVRGTPGEPIPAPASGTFGDADRERIEELRVWFTQRQINGGGGSGAGAGAPTASNPAYLRLLKDLNPNSDAYFDLIGQVKGFALDSHPRLFLWDGTQPPSACAHSLQHNEHHTEPYECAIISLTSHLPPTIGNGQFIKLRNLHAVQSGDKKTFDIVWTAGTTVTLLAESDPEAQAVILRAPRYVTRTPLENLPTTPFSAVLAAPAPAKFRCRGTVISYSPANVSEFCREQCTVCNRIRNDVEAPPCECDPDEAYAYYKYMFLLNVRDHSGVLQVMVVDDDATNFLGGLGASDLTQSTVTRKVVQDRMDELLQNGMDFCVMLYEAQINNNPIRCYRLFHTTFINQ